MTTLPATPPPSSIAIPECVKAFIFDCDGTIADTMPLHFEAWGAALGEHGAELAEPLFYEWAGMPTRTIIELLNERHGWKIPVEQAALRKRDFFLETLARVRPIDPVVALVEAYAGKIPMAVASGGGRSVVTKTLEALGLQDRFQAIVTMDDIDPSRGKPAPDLFLEAAGRLGVAPADCLAFEDADLGIESARAAGIPVIDVRPYWPPKYSHASR